jgi:hypothetical protein
VALSVTGGSGVVLWCFEGGPSEDVEAVMLGGVAV